MVYAQSWSNPDLLSPEQTRPFGAGMKIQANATWRYFDVRCLHGLRILPARDLSRGPFGVDRFSPDRVYTGFLWFIL